MISFHLQSRAFITTHKYSNKCSYEEDVFNSGVAFFVLFCFWFSLFGLVWPFKQGLIVFKRVSSSQSDGIPKALPLSSLFYLSFGKGPLDLFFWWLTSHFFSTRYMESCGPSSWLKRAQALHSVCLKLSQNSCNLEQMTAASLYKVGIIPDREVLRIK